MIYYVFMLSSMYQGMKRRWGGVFEDYCVIRQPLTWFGLFCTYNSYIASAIYRLHVAFKNFMAF
jgi:hypothetical protein